MSEKFEIIINKDNTVDIIIGNFKRTHIDTNKFLEDINKSIKIEKGKKSKQ